MKNSMSICLERKTEEDRGKTLIIYLISSASSLAPVCASFAASFEIFHTTITKQGTNSSFVRKMTAAEEA